MRGGYSPAISVFKSTNLTLALLGGQFFVICCFTGIYCRFYQQVICQRIYWFWKTAMDAGERQAIVEAAVAALQALYNQGLYSGGAVRPDRFPSNIYSHWLEWKRHFVWISEANGWTDDQSRSALPTCLTSWALDEFSAMPQQYRVQVQGQPAPTFQSRIQECRSGRK